MVWFILGKRDGKQFVRFVEKKADIENFMNQKFFHVIILTSYLEFYF